MTISETGGIIAEMKTIEQFCKEHSACRDGEQWAIANCASMQEAWDKAKAEWLIWIATRRGVLTDKELRLFAVWSARQVQNLMTDQRSLNALDVAERFANGNATVGELAAAWDAARAAAGDAARDAAWDAAGDAARAAARAAAGAAAGDAAGDAAWDAAWDAAGDAAWDAARAAAGDAAGDARAAWAAAGDAAGDAQAMWLRMNTIPNFN